LQTESHACTSEVHVCKAECGLATREFQLLNRLHACKDEMHPCQTELPACETNCVACTSECMRATPNASYPQCTAGLQCGMHACKPRRPRAKRNAELQKDFANVVHVRRARTDGCRLVYIRSSRECTRTPKSLLDLDFVCCRVFISRG